MPNRVVHKMRENYQSSFLLEEDCDIDPFLQFDKWFHDAIESKIQEPNAMTLATVGNDGQPSARIVLLKSFSKNGFIFYTNTKSHKGKQIKENNKVALLFWWQERQVRIEGKIKKVDKATAAKYFHSRPKGSQISACISPQSRVVKDRATLVLDYKTMEKEFKGKEIPFPGHWGGYIVVPEIFEFWQGRISRLHDRIRYKLNASVWKIERLAP